MQTDITKIDHYLSLWDRFANGDNSLSADIRDHQSSFENALSQLLDDGDLGAPSRLVFYAVVQVGGFIDIRSPLGKSGCALLGSAFPVFKSKDGVEALFAGDLYFWWLKNSKAYKPCKLLDTWLSSDFANSVSIPMYLATGNQNSENE